MGSQHIKDYTTVYETIIDHIYTNISVYWVNVGILETYYSDHKAIWIAVKKELCKFHWWRGIYELKFLIGKDWIRCWRHEEAEKSLFDFISDFISCKVNGLFKFC